MGRTVFLDLDGTLTDPKAGICGAFAQVLREQQIAVPDPLTWIIGPPLIGSFEAVGVPDPEAALARYRTLYSGGGLFQAQVYPGIIDVLARLATSHRLCLATAKPHVFAKRITAHFGLDRFLSEQFGPELDGTRNDKAELLQHACTRLGLDPTRAVMVGDRVIDRHAAETNGMPFIGVMWGYGAPGELDGATALCNAPAELEQHIAALA